MALKALMIRKKIEESQAKLEEFKGKEEALAKREEELEEALGEINEESTDEERETVEESIDEYEEENESLKEEKSSLEEKIKELQDELAKYEEAEDEEDDEEDEEAERKAPEVKLSMRGSDFMRLETRERLKNVLAKEENRDFYTKVAGAMQNRAGFQAGGELLIPEDVVYEINQRIGDYGVLYNLVGKIQLNGTARVVMNSGTVELFWTEKCADLKDVTLGSLDSIELDNYKLGGYLFLCNAFIEDSAIDLANFINSEFAKGIAVALDKAIYDGKGATEKQPEGIKSVVKTATHITDILGLLQAVGSINALGAENNSIEGTVTAVANRKTLYKYIFPETYGKDANGKLVYGLGNNLPDGTRIALCNVIPDNEVLIGDFANGYLLGIRKGMTFDTNDRLKWVEEQTGFKVSGRYDGKVIRKDYFARVIFDEAKPETPQA